MKYFKRDGFFRLECPAGDYTEIKEFSDNCAFWDSIFSDNCVFGQGCRFDNCIFGDNCSFGKYCNFTKSCKFGKGHTLSYGCFDLGDGIAHVARQYTDHDNRHFLTEQILHATSEQLSQLIVKDSQCLLLSARSVY